MKKILVLLTTMFAVLLTAFPCLSQEIDFNSLMESAKQGNAKAQYFVGTCYLNGEGVAQNYTEAVKWLKLSAKQGLAEAQYNFGICYYNGFGVKKNQKKAVEWIQLAAEQGLSNAQSLMGVSNYYGYGVKKDYVEAVKWYKLAAEQGVPAVQFLLGNCYFLGEGVQQDYEESAKWYKMAAEQGYDEAQFILGTLYYNGWGVPKNSSEAIKWLKIAADQGHEGAKMFLVEEGVPLNAGKLVDDGTENVQFQLVKEPPTFMGGDANAFSVWVNQHLVYPESAKESGIQGRVTLQFTVDTDGSVCNVVILRGVDPALDAEAFRVVSSSPKWSPGKNDDGEIVRVTYTFPVMFQLR